MVHKKVVFLAGLALALSSLSHGMENQVVVRSPAYYEVHNELMDMCCAPLASFDQKRFDILLKNFNINADYADTRDIVYQKGVTLLGAACVRANCHAVDSLLKKGANPNLPTQFAILPMFAVMASSAQTETQIACLELLKAHGADFKSPIDVYNSDTPLHKAANQYPHIVPYLLKQDNMLVNGLDNYGRTPLMCALEGFRNNLHTQGAVRELMLHKANVSIIDSLGRSVWHYAAQYEQRCLAHNKRGGCTVHATSVMCNPYMVQLLKTLGQEKNL